MSYRFTSYRQEVLDHVQQAISNALEICGGKAEDYTVDNIERNHSVRTSNLVQSITHEPKGTAIKNEVAIGTNVYYAPFVELGHHQTPGRYVPAIKKRLVRSWVPGKPFLRPAVENHKDEFGKIIQSELSK